MKLLVTWYCVLVISLAVAWPSCAEAQAESPVDIVATYMAQDRLPSLSVAVWQRDTPAYAAAWGLADIENNVQATANTVYRIGSTSKVITAVAVMQLAGSGRLDLDLPVQTYCKAFPEKDGLITPRLLLAHLGGIRHYNYQRFREEFLSNKRYGSVEEALGIFKDDPLIAQPGERYLYSSFGYVLLSCAVEGASGVSFSDYLETNVSKVAGMTQTRPDIPENIVPHRARTYSTAEDGAWTNSPCVDLSDRYAAGGMLSTPRDLVTFGAALLEGNLLPNETLTEMIEPQNTRVGDEFSYGLGWQLSDQSGEIFHGGTSVGGSAFLYIRVDTGTVVAMTTNVDRWTTSRLEVARALGDWAEGR